MQDMTCGVCGKSVGLEGDAFVVTAGGDKILAVLPVHADCHVHADIPRQPLLDLAERPEFEKVIIKDISDTISIITKVAEGMIVTATIFTMMHSRTIALQQKQAELEQMLESVKSQGAHGNF